MDLRGNRNLTSGPQAVPTDRYLVTVGRMPDSFVGTHIASDQRRYFSGVFEVLSVGNSGGLSCNVVPTRTELRYPVPSPEVG